MDMLNVLKKNMVYVIIAIIILVTIATFIPLTEKKPIEGKASSPLSLKCETWVANPDAVFENIVYDSKNNVIMPLLKNTGDKDIHIVSMGVNYGFKGPVADQEANITLKPHSGKLIEIPTDMEPNRIVILTDKPCEEIAISKPEEGWNTVLQENKVKASSEPFRLKYNFSLLYVVLYDDPKDINVDVWKNRLEWFNRVMNRESLGKLKSNTTLIFLDIRELGDKKLDYSRRSYAEWYNALGEHFKEYNYDILGFTPIIPVKWCSDAGSVGHNINGKIMFCKEFENDDQNIVIGIAHRMLHSLGYNHLSEENKQLIFLDWFLGLPRTKYLPHTIIDQTEGMFFNKHFLKVLGILPKDRFEEKCLDSKGLVCVKKDSENCKNSYGPYCLDTNKDGTIDSEDDYVFSSPISGKDSDNDGIIDSLDLCNWTKIRVAGGLKVGKMKLIASKSMDITFKSDSLKINKIKSTKYNMFSGIVMFPDENSEIIKGDGFGFDFKWGVWRLQVFYNYNGSEFYRTYFLYAIMDANYIIEKEWYYFSRFGCDVPANLDLSDYENYDSDLDGLPDKDKFAFASRIDESYDWDNDGITDVYDTLPTVAGNCSNNFVKGVLDSDNDGLCDPGYFNFGKVDTSITSEFTYKFGDLVRRVGKNPLYDQCPYFPGAAENNGCPDLDKDNFSWYKDLCPFDKNNDCKTYDVNVVLR